jgi:hypothetical protein
MTAGGQTPEELETLLEDALLMHDAAALAQLFEDAWRQSRSPGMTVTPYRPCSRPTAS